jgi:hypothetical protein
VGTLTPVATTPPRPVPEPLEVDTVRIVVGGTIIWFAAFLALLPFHGRLVANGHELWLWTCLAGAGLGPIGLPMCLRQRRAVQRDRAAVAKSE